MKLVQLTPGTGSFHCGSCLRDNTLVRALRDQGHDALIVPLYLPFVLDAPRSEPAAAAPLFLGGINTFLQYKSALFRRAPRWLTRALDAPPLLRWSSTFAGMTAPDELGALTTAMLADDMGPQERELERLVRWLEGIEGLELVVLSNVMLCGAARAIKSALDVPVIATLQGEAPFLDALPEPHRAVAWRRLSERAADCDGFISVSEDYGARMGARLGIEPRLVRTVFNGIEVTDFTPAPRRATGYPLRLGYLARMCPDKGLERLVEAYIQLCERPDFEGLELRVVGALTPEHKPYVAELRGRLERAGLTDRTRFLANVERDVKIRELQAFDLLTVPALYGESFGLYILEALACGVPVVQPRVAAFPELLASFGGGMLYDPTRAGAYVEALAALLHDPVQRAQLSSEGRAGVLARGQASHMATAAVAAYMSLLEASRSRPGRPDGP